MELRMSDDPLSRLPSFSRVSIQAVLVKEGEDPSAALAEAGLVNPVAIPVLLGDEPHLSGGILGDGITPNLTAFLESAYPDDRDASPHSQPAKAACSSQGDTAGRTGHFRAAARVRFAAVRAGWQPEQHGSASGTPIRNLRRSHQPLSADPQFVRAGGSHGNSQREAPSHFQRNGSIQWRRPQ